MTRSRKRRNAAAAVDKEEQLEAFPMTSVDEPPATKKQRRQIARAASEAAALAGPAVQLSAQRVSTADNEANKHTKSKWINRERILSVAGRGVSYRGRHLLRDLRRLMPHHKTETKFDSRTRLLELNEIASMQNATKVLFMESRKKSDLYLWMAASKQVLVWLV